MALRALTARFGSWSALALQQAHVARRGLFIPAPTPTPEPFTELALSVVAPDGRQLDLHAQLVQIAPGAGIALTFDPSSAGARELAELVRSAAAAGPDEAGGPTEVYWGSPSEEPASPAARVDQAVDDELDDVARGLLEAVEEGPSELLEAVDDAPSEPLEPVEETLSEETETLQRQIRAMGTPEKMRLAIHGDRAARMLLLKDANKTIQLFVIQNKRITIGEVLYLAAYRQANPEVLTRIGENRDWTGHPGVVGALVGNPKTPTTTALRLLRQLGAADLRRLAKSPNVPRAISQAAKRLVIGS